MLTKLTFHQFDIIRKFFGHLKIQHPEIPIFGANFQMGGGLSVFKISKNYLTTSFSNPNPRQISKAQGVLEKFNPPNLM